jgi:putative copper export protein
MRTLYLISVWAHILATTVWVGGMLFLVLVVVPWLRAGNQASGAAFLSDTGRRFRTIGWVCFGILLATGTFNLWLRGVRLGDFARPEWLGSPLGRIVVLKLALFCAVLLVSGAHDFVVGPRATAAIMRDPRSAQARSLRRFASVLGRTNALLALAIVFVAVMFVRGGL